MYSYIRFSDGRGACFLGISNLGCCLWYLYLKRPYLSTSQMVKILGYFQDEKSARLALDMIACASGEIIYNDMDSI